MGERKDPLTIDTISHQTGLAPETVRYCLQIGLVSISLTKDDLAELRRIRRLEDLEVNLAGIEIIVRMRRRMVALQTEVEHLRRTGRGEPEG